MRRFIKQVLCFICLTASQVKARDEGRLKELAAELDALKKTRTGLQRRLQQESSQCVLSPLF